MLKKLYWNLFIRFLAIKWVFRKTLGDEVVYKGKIYTLNNGVCFPSWDSYSHDVHTVIPDSECKKVWSIRGMLRSYRSGLFFYKTNWLSIWIDIGIKPWMRECNIF